MRRLAPLLLALTLAGCGYFNSLYNANRRFADAERARARGDASARVAYEESIEKAAVSYRKYPDSRWADDALLLIGRAHFALGHDDEAAAALGRVLERTTDEATSALAHAYLGAALVRLERPDSAAAHLQRAATSLDPSSAAGALTRLWRARAAFAQQRVADGWTDLDALAQRGGGQAVDVALETAAQAVVHADSARFTAALARLARLRGARVAAEQIQRTLTDAAARWSAGELLRMTTPLAQTSWGSPAAEEVTLFRADLAVQAGDTAGAIALAMDVAEAVRGGAGSRARMAVARWRLAQATTAEQLDEIRTLLLPAFDDPEALALQRALAGAQILIDRGASAGAALALFVAAEMARDELAAPVLARRLFLQLVQLTPAAPWSGKALLAAAALSAGSDTGALLERYRDNVYLRTARGEPTDDEYTLAEQRLARGMAGLRSEALAEAAARDVVVGRALVVLDSTRTAARMDSVRIVCGTLIDSLRVTGVRADSTRTACLRGDSVRIAFVLTADTMMLLDSAKVRVRRASAPKPAVVRPDTLPTHP